MQNALHIMKNSKHPYIVFLSVPQSRLAGGIMFWPCPFVRTSVRLFVRLLPNCERYTSKTNEPISMTIGINLPQEGRERSTSGVRRSKIKVTGDRSFVWKPGRDVILGPLSRVDKGM